MPCDVVTSRAETGSGAAPGTTIVTFEPVFGKSPGAGFGVGESHLPDQSDHIDTDCIHRWPGPVREATPVSSYSQPNIRPKIRFQFFRSTSTA